MSCSVASIQIRKPATSFPIFSSVAFHCLAASQTRERPSTQRKTLAISATKSARPWKRRLINGPGLTFDIPFTVWSHYGWLCWTYLCDCEPWWETQKETRSHTLSMTKTYHWMEPTIDSPTLRRVKKNKARCQGWKTHHAWESARSTSQETKTHIEATLLKERYSSNDESFMLGGRHKERGLQFYDWTSSSYLSLRHCLWLLHIWLRWAHVNVWQC